MALRNELRADALLPSLLPGYTHDVLQDALVYSDHAASRTGMASNISLDDVQLAIQARVNHEFTGPPPKEVSLPPPLFFLSAVPSCMLTQAALQMLLSLASTVNSVPLPPISERYGVRLPPAQHCLTNIDYSVIPNAPPVRTDAFAQLDSANGAAQHEGQRGTVGEEDAEDVRDADGDRAMAGALEQRGTKRGLEEDDDYD